MSKSPNFSSTREIKETLLPRRWFPRKPSSRAPAGRPRRSRAQLWHAPARGLVPVPFLPRATALLVAASEKHRRERRGDENLLASHGSSSILWAWCSDEVRVAPAGEAGEAQGNGVTSRVGLGANVRPWRTARTRDGRLWSAGRRCQLGSKIGTDARWKRPRRHGAERGFEVACVQLRRR